MASLQEKKSPFESSLTFRKPGVPTDIFKSMKLPSLKNELQATRRATKEKGDKKPKKIFSSTALNLPVQFVGSCKLNERSKKRKAYFRMGNLAMLSITSEASPYTVQDPDNPHIIRLYPMYNSLSLMQWPKLDVTFPLDPTDCIVLESDKVYVISVDPELCEDMKSGDFLELVDVRFTVFASRDEIPDRIRDKYKNPNGKGIAWKNVPEEELAWSPKTHKIEPIFFFNAKSYKALPSVSTESILKVFDNRGLVSHFIPKPTEEQLAYYTRNARKYSNNDSRTEGNGISSEVYDSELDAMVPEITAPSIDPEGGSEGRMVIYQEANEGNAKTKPEAFRMPDRFNPIPIFLIPFDGSDSGEPMQHFRKETGTIQTLETYYVSSDEINMHDAAKDKEETKRLKDFKVPGIFEKSWRFTFDAIQAEYKLKFGDDGQPDGFDDIPVNKENVMCRMNIYERTIEESFGIYEDKAWERFIALYKPYFRATIQCQANWNRTKSRMERIQSISSGGSSSFVVTGMDTDMEGDSVYDNSSSLGYSHAFEWNADHIIFDFRKMIGSIGVPISSDMANNFAKRLGYLRRQGRAPHGIYSDVKNMKVWNTHAVACMNAFSDHGKAVRYIESGLEKQYFLVLLPTKLLSGAFSKGIYSWPQGSTDLGDQLVSILYDIDPENPMPRDPSKTIIGFDPNIHDPRVGEVADCLIKSDFKTDRDVLTALLFAVWPINKSSFAREAEAVAKFLGIPDQVHVVDAALHPEKTRRAELTADIGNTGSEEGHDPAEEGEVTVDDYTDDMMEPSQQMLGSLEQQEIDEGIMSASVVEESGDIGEIMEESVTRKKVVISEDDNTTHEVPRKTRKRISSRSSVDRRHKKARSPNKRRGGR